MTELLMCLAQGGELEHSGHVYRFAQTTIEVMAAWEEWLTKLTYDRLVRVSGNPASALDSVGRLAASGALDFFSAESQRMMDLPNGLKRLCFIKVKACNPAVTEKEISDLVEANFEEMVLARAAELQAAENLRPNAESPATQAGQTTNP